MRINNLFKRLSLVLCMVLIAAMTLLTACGDNKETGKEEPQSSSTTENGAEQNDATVLGEGETSFKFVCVDGDGKEVKYIINTDKTTVGEALLEHKLIEGDESEYGLYVKKVNGILADYDKDKTYWAFYINGEYAMTGVDKTNIEADATYTFKVEK